MNLDDTLAAELSRLRHDIDILRANYEALRADLRAQNNLSSQLRQAHKEKVGFLDRAQQLEQRAQTLEELAREIEFDTVRRAELADWRRAHRRANTAIAFGVAAVAAILIIMIVLFGRQHESLHKDLAESKRTLCAFMQARASIATTPEDKILAAEAAKLLVAYECKT